MILKKSIACGINNGSTVYCAILDATKALGLVEYCKLFKLLTQIGSQSVINRLLLNMYTGHLVSCTEFSRTLYSAPVTIYCEVSL